MADVSKDFSMDDIATLFGDLMHGDNGMYSNTVFAPSPEAYRYDSVAATSASIQNELIRKYMKPMTELNVLRRQNALAATTGLGDAVPAAINAMMAFNPSMGMGMMQLHGYDDAVNQMLRMGNSIAATRNGNLANILDPRQMAINMRFAASQGALALNNNFNKDGSIDVSQTHGISLPMASIIAGKVMSDRSQYDAWAARMKGRGASLTKDELLLTDQEIENFRSGVGTTERAEKSYNKQIKEFTSEINKFVASVSKMTGSYSEAIEFMQRMTGGQLFKAGSEASDARNKAARIAINMRIAAANAGMSSEELYTKSTTFSNYFYNATGTNSIYNPTMGMSVGAQGAAAFAAFKANNPGANDRELERAEFGIMDNIADYYGGDMARLNVVAARLMDNGMLSKEAYRKAQETGNFNSAFSLVANAYGGGAKGESMVESLMNDKKNIELNRRMYARTIEDLDAVGLGVSIQRERVNKGSRELFGNLLDNFAKLSQGDREEQIKAAEERLGYSRRDALLSDEAFKAAGVEDKETKDRIRSEVQAKNLDINDTLSLLNRNHVSGRKMYDASKDVFRAKAAEKSDTAAMAALDMPSDEFEGRKKLDQILKQKIIDKLDKSGLEEKELSRLKAKSKDYDAEGILSEIDKQGGNSRLVEMSARKEAMTQILDESPDGAAKDLLRDEYNKLFGDKNIVALRKDAYKNRAISDRKSAILDLQKAIAGSKQGDEKVLGGYLRQFDSMVKRGISGKDGFVFEDDLYLKTLFSDNLKGDLKDTDKTRAIDQALSEYKNVRNRGGTVDEAFNAVTSSKNGKQYFNDRLTSESERKKAFDKMDDQVKLRAAADLYAKKFAISAEEVNAAIADTSSNGISAKFSRRDRNQNDASVLEDLVKEALKGKISSEIDSEYVKSVEKELFSTGGEFETTVRDESMRFKSGGIGVNEGEIAKQASRKMAGLQAKMLSKKMSEKYGGKEGSYEKSYMDLYLKNETAGPGKRMSEEEMTLAALKETYGENAADAEGFATAALKDVNTSLEENASLSVESYAGMMKTFRNNLIAEGLVGNITAASGASLNAVKRKTAIDDLRARVSAVKSGNPELSDREAVRKALDGSFLSRNVEIGTVADDTIDSVISGSDRTVKERLIADVDNDVVDMVSGNSGQLAAGMAAGDPSDFGKVANESSVARELRSSLEVVLGDLGTAFVQAADSRDAANNNKQFAVMDKQARARIESAMKLNEKIEAIQGVKKQLVNDDKSIGGVETLALQMANFNQLYGALEGAEYEKKFEEMSPGMISTFKELKRQGGISLKEAVTTIAAGAGKSGADIENAERSAYVNQRIKSGMPELSRNTEEATYLFRIAEATELLAKKFPG